MIMKIKQKLKTRINWFRSSRNNIFYKILVILGITKSSSFEWYKAGINFCCDINKELNMEVN